MQLRASGARVPECAGWRSELLPSFALPLSRFPLSHGPQLNAPTLTNGGRRIGNGNRTRRRRKVRLHGSHTSSIQVRLRVYLLSLRRGLTTRRTHSRISARPRRMACPREECRSSSVTATHGYSELTTSTSGPLLIEFAKTIYETLTLLILLLCGNTIVRQHRGRRQYRRGGAHCHSERPARSFARTSRLPLRGSS